MKRVSHILILTALILSASLTAASGAKAPATANAARPHYPASAVEVVRDTLHGVVVEDRYRWLEDKDSPATRDWITRQIAFTDSALARIPGRESIRARLEPLIKVESRDLPQEQGGRYFFARRTPDQDLQVLYVRRSPTGQDEVLVDPHPLTPDHTVSVSFADLSSDGTLAAINYRKGGEDETEVAFLDVDTHKELPDRLPRARYLGISIAADKRSVFYSRFGPEGPRVFRHTMGTEFSKDSLLFGEGYGRDKIASAGLSDDGRWLQIVVFHGSSGPIDIYVRNAAGGPIVPVVTDLAARSFGSIAGDRMFLRTDWQASNGRVMAVDLLHPARDSWKEIIPATDHVLDNVTVAGGKLYLRYLENVISRLRVFDFDGKPLGEVTLPGIGSITGTSGRPESNELFLQFSSLSTPTTIFHLDTKAGPLTEWWRSPVPIASADFEVKQVWFPSKDGTKIPMFLAYRKGLKLDGTHPVYLTGYGGFTVSEQPRFSSRAAYWIQSGGVYALANLRGGGEFGETWHKAGMLEKKQNVFDDFIGAAEWLIANHYTSPAKLAIEGRSNGGLLVGAALTQRPELYRAVICGFPLLDMLRYQNFLVARFWVPEYGSSEDSAQFRTLRAYSPYHRVKPGVHYPAVLLVSGDSDTRVDPLHARKMAALLQASTGSGADRPVLLHYDLKSGHSAGKPISAQIDDDTDELLFLAGQLGMTSGAAATAGSTEAPAK